MNRRLFARPRRGARAIGLCLAAVIAAMLLPSAAKANTYPVRTCNDSGGPNHAWAQYHSSGNTNLAFPVGCPNGDTTSAGNTNQGMVVRSIANGLATPNGALGGWKLTAPGGNTLSSISLSDWIARDNAHGFYSMLLDDFTGREGCWNGSTICAYVNGYHTVPLSGSRAVRMEVGCLNVGGCLDNGSGTGGIFALYRATVTVNDNTTPSAAPSGSLWTAAWQRGVRSIGVTGSDTADGIQANQVVIDGKEILRQDHGCDFTYVSPCVGTVSDSWNYDTSQLSDGAHSIQANTYDAGWLGNTAPGTIFVDNHAPDMSQATVAVAQGADWTSSNSFDLSWTNPSGQAAPIGAAHYSVCQAADTSNCSVGDGRVAGNDIHSLNNLQVPAAGDYVVRVWLEDSVGNANSGMSSVPVHLRYDPTAPGLSAPAHRNGWINAQEAKTMPQRVKLDPRAQVGPSGIKGYSVTSDGSTPDNVVNAVGPDATITLNDLPEGKNIIKARAISGALVPAADSDIGITEVDVDKTAPDSSLIGAPDPSQWQRGPVALALIGADQANLSTMQGADLAHQQIKEGGYIEYRLDGSPAQDAPAENVIGLNVENTPLIVSTDGAHTITYKAVDRAGNESAEKTVQFKIDQTAPELAAFEAQDPSQPATMRVAVADRTSGVAGGVIEMREQGSDSWTDLPTQLDGDHLVANVDDSKLTAGLYEFQVRVRDNARNETVSNRRRDGRPEVLAAPFRFDTRMAAGIVKPGAKKAKPKKVSATCRRSKKCMSRVRKQRAAAKKKAQALKPLTGTVSSTTVPYGKSALVKGTLESSDGMPIARQPVDVYQRLDASGQQLVRIATLRTNGAGQFDYHAPKGTSRTIKFQFDGTDALHPASAQVKVLVPASSTLRANRHFVMNGQTVRFSGRIGRPVVDGLKIIDLQAFYRGKWRTFATPRTTAKGTWKYTYRFEATAGLVNYRFRVRIRREASYPYQLGYSRPMTVTVRGR
jgi:hypothetical protein